MALEFDQQTAAVDRTPAGKPSLGERTLSFGASKVSADDRMFFTEQLALLLETGTNLYSALEAIVTQTESPAMQAVVERLAADVAEGKSFGYALAQHEAVFSTTYVNLISASEHGGFLHEVLQQLLEMEHKREQLRSTLFSAAAYPVFLMAFSLAVVVFVLVVVFPKFSDMFGSIYDQLPGTTKVLMQVSDLLRTHWALLLGGLGLAIVAGRAWLRSERGQFAIDRAKLAIPVLRDVFTEVYLVQMLRVLGLSLGNGVSVMESLESCRDVVHNSLYRELIRDVEARVQDGAGFAAGFADAPIMPELARHMIATGEQTGSLAKVMTRVADYYEAQLTKRLNTLSKLAEPLMLLVMGVVVGLLVSSLILPIFKLSRAVG